jgi:diguanylate cyclase (GGDEF)-like protein/PAS domain S-box-containing protein
MEPTRQLLLAAGPPVAGSEAPAAGDPGHNVSFPHVKQGLLRNSSIRIKLLLLMAMNSSFALVLAGASILGYEALQYRATAIRELTTIAEIAGASSSAAISFGDEDAASETLLPLRGDSRVIGAALYDDRGRLLGTLPNRSASAVPIPQNPRRLGVYFENSNNILIFHPVVFQGQRIGTIYIRSDMTEVYGQLARYAGIVSLVMLASLALGLLLSSRLEKIISAPIATLVGVARLVSTNKDYTQRAAKFANDEIGVLFDSFNEMLAQIQVRDQDQKIADEALRQSEERYALAAHGSNDGLWDWKLDTNEIYFSPRWIRMLGYSDNEIWANPEDWFSRIHPADRARVRAQLNAHFQGLTPEFSSEYRILHKNGRYIWMLSRGIAVRDKSGVAVRIAGSQTDITEGKVADTLTELPNRVYFVEKLESAIAAAANPGAVPFAVLFLDLDRFKVVNDSLGHTAGDQLLIGVAQRLRSSVRGPALSSNKTNGTDSTVARLGGDEFAILLEGIRDETSAGVVAQRILRSLGAPFYIDKRKVFSTASIGIAMSSSAGTPDDLLRNADTAMYDSKVRGKGAFEVFNQTMLARTVARIEIERDMKKALEDGDFVLYYQPIVSLASRRITGFEALVRWNHPVRGLVYPNEFIPVAEDTGMIVPLGLWVLREGCRQMAAWQKSVVADPPLTISINVSQKQLAEPSFIEKVEQVLRETRLDPKTLRLEVTESSIMKNPEATISLLNKLKALNIGLEIDDFGTGYSSLSYLRQLPFDTLKIDYSFVKELGTADDSSDIIQTILGLARSLGMDVVAEGVETKDQIARLTAMGCLQVQGFYFSRPVDAEKARGLLRDEDTPSWDLLLPADQAGPGPATIAGQP